MDPEGKYRWIDLGEYISQENLKEDLIVHVHPLPEKMSGEEVFLFLQGSLKSSLGDRRKGAIPIELNAAGYASFSTTAIDRAVSSAPLRLAVVKPGPEHFPGAPGATVPLLETQLGVCCLASEPGAPEVDVKANRPPGTGVTIIVAGVAIIITPA